MMLTKHLRQVSHLILYGVLTWFKPTTVKLDITKLKLKKLTSFVQPLFFGYELKFFHLHFIMIF